MYCIYISYLICQVITEFENFYFLCLFILLKITVIMYLRFDSLYLSANCWFVLAELWKKCLMIRRPEEIKIIFLRDRILLRVRVLSGCRLVVEGELTETAGLYQGWQSPVEPGGEREERGGGLFVLLVLSHPPVSGVTLLL